MIVNMISIRYRMQYLMADLCYVDMQDRLVPALGPEEASGIITASEKIVKEYASKASLNAKQVK
jgi:hypothetical protein